MIKISHECPLVILKESRLFNDYDYCLVHLTNESWKYKNFYIKSVKKGRDVLLDNSVFELGEAFSIKKFIKKIQQLKPTQYVVPDVFGDAQNTIKNFKKFDEYIKDKNITGVKIGVVQGRTYEEIKECYKFMSENADKIALSFNMKYFLERKEDSVLKKLSRGRPELVKKLQDEGLWNFNKPHHLLGCTLYEEFRINKELYRRSSIESLDTSNPVVAGIMGLKYDGINGLQEKPSIKLYELINCELTKEQINKILYNIIMFREGMGD